MPHTRFQDLLTDPRFVQTKQEMLACLKEHSARITKIEPAKKELALSCEKTIREFEAVRAGELAIPYLASGLGNGALVELADGSVKYDFIIGIGVHYFGHSHPGLIGCVLDAAMEDTVMQGNLMQNGRGLDFSNLLIKTANARGAGLAHCFLTSSGAMAGENALKIAFQKKHPADRILCFENCFMGRTLALSQATDNPAYRQGLPKTLNVDYVPFFDPDDPDQSIKKSVMALKDHLKKYPKQHAAMCLELVLGEGGFYPGNREFFLALIEVLRNEEVAVLVDEVQTFGRTSEPFAFQHFGLDEFVDVVWIGKASQVCATLFREGFKPKPGLLSQTYTASTTAIAVGHYILRSLLDGDYFGPQGKIVALHEHFKNNLAKISAEHPNLLRGPYGIGAMVAFTPFDGKTDTTKAFLKKLFAEGVIAYSCGKDPSRVRFLLSVGAVTKNDIDGVTAVIRKTLVAISQIPEQK